MDWREAFNVAAMNMDLRNHCGHPVRFVPQSDLPSGMPYETFISETGGIPTRDNVHDYFNALVWLTFPQIKTRLNALQARELAKPACEKAVCNKGSRGKLRDGVTIFDENAAILVTRDGDLVAALRGHRWRELFVERREAWRDCEVRLFGHALMEKLTAPYKAITAHVWVVLLNENQDDFKGDFEGDFFALPPEGRRAWIDATVAAQLQAGVMTSDLTPLPILGIPGWHEGQDDAFYADTSVFRINKVINKKL